MSTESRPVGDAGRLELIVFGLILAITAVLYWPALDFPFVYDDVKQIANNPRVNEWPGIVSGFTEGVWGFDETKADRYYRPVFLSVLTLCQMLSSGSPTAIHIASLLLHLLNIALLWQIARALDTRPVARLIGCGLFALHPIQIQAVVWASAISDPLTTSFALTALLAASRWRRSGRMVDSLLIATFFGLACLTLERAFAMALPLLLWMSYRPDHTQGSWAPASISKLARGAIPIAVAMVFALGLRMNASGNAGGAVQLNVTETLLTIPSVVLRDLSNLVLPARLSLAYPERMLSDASATHFVVPLAVCLTVALGLLLASRRSARRQLLLSCFVCLMALPLWVGLLPGYALVQDRYLYLPLAFFFLWLGDVIATASERPSSVLARRSATFALVAAALSLIALHSSNLRFWQSEISLYQRCVASAPENPLFLMNLSNAMSRAQQPDTSCELLHKAVEEIGLDPRRGAPALTHFSLGNCLRRRGELPLALAEYDAAQRFAEGNFSQAYENAAVTLLDLGDDAAALARAEILVDRWPASATGFKLAGIVYARRGEFARAASELRHARERAPDDAEIASLLRRVEAENARSSGDR